MSFALAEAIVAGLRGDHPEWIDLARRNIERWERLTSDAPELIRGHREWGAILDRPVPGVCRVLLDPSVEGQRLRQNPPVAGALAPAVVWGIKRRTWDEARAA